MPTATVKKITDKEAMTEARKLVKQIDKLDERLDGLSEAVKEVKALREQTSANLRQLLRGGDMPLMDGGQESEDDE